VDLSVSFPSDSILPLPSLNTHVKLMVLPNEMTIENASMFNFGLEGIEEFVIENFYQTTNFQKTIQPSEDVIFNVILLTSFEGNTGVVNRTGVCLKGEELYYKLRVNSEVEKLMPCGRLTSSFP